MSASLSEITGTQAARDRRLIMRAVDYWESIQGAHRYPRMANFDIDAVPDMAAQSFLIDINVKNVHLSELKYVGEALTHDCSQSMVGKPVSNVPRGSLVSRLTDHFMQILANRAPMSFEAEYNDAAGTVTKYRGIMMPLSDAGQEIDYILGVINCRGEDMPARSKPALELAEPVAAPEPQAAPASVAEFPQRLPGTAPTEPPMAAVCDMMDELRECRGAAYMVEDARQRLRQREFRALEMAYRMLHSARDNPLVFSGVLEECGTTLNERDLVATVLTLTFGSDYPEETMTLYATVLRRALADRQTPDTLRAYLEGLEGGFEGLMRDEPIPLDLGGLLRPR